MWFVITLSRSDCIVQDSNIVWAAVRPCQQLDQWATIVPTQTDKTISCPRVLLQALACVGTITAGSLLPYLPHQLLSCANATRKHNFLGKGS